MPLEVADRPRDAGAAKKKREPLVPIPADAPKMPDLQKMKGEIDALRTEVDGHKKAIADIRAKADERRQKEDDPRKKLIDAKKDLQSKRAEAANEVAKLRQERNDLQGKVNGIRQTARDQERDIRAMNKELGSLMTVDQIDAKIKELEYKLESGHTGTVKAERAVMKEIKQLQAVREKANQMGAKAEMVFGQRTEEDNLLEQVKSKQRDIDAKSAEIANILKQMDEKQDELNSFTGAADAKKDREEREALSAKITECYAKMDAARAKFDKEKKAYEEWKVDYDKKCQEVREKRRKEREEEDRKYAEKQKEKELLIAAIKRLNPHEEEIANAESLIGYLKAKIAFQARDDRKKEEAKNSAAAHFDPTQAAVGKGMAVLKKNDEDDWLFGNTKAKKAAAAKSKPKVEPKPAAEKPEPVVKSKPISHNSEKLEAFASLGVKVPHNTLEVKEVIEELKKKKAHWESFKKTEKEALEEEKADREKKAAEEAAKKAAEEAEDEE